MARFKPLLARLFALLLLVQSGAAVAHCLGGMAPGAADPGDGLLAEICAAQGKRLVRLGADGLPGQAPAPAAEPGFCPVCHGLPEVALPIPATQWLGPRTVTAPAWHARGHALRLPPARAPPYATRAPPLLA